MSKNYKPVINVVATAAKIKTYRIRAGYSVREIQNIFNFSSPEAIYAWEKGKYLPTIDNMIVIASVYGVKVDDFVVTSNVEIECDIEAREAESA